MVNLLEVPFQGVPFVFLPSEGIGPPFISTLNIPGLNIGLPVWLFSLVIPITPNVSNVTSPPGEDRPQPNPSPSSSVVASSLSSSLLDQSSMVSRQVDKKKKKGKGKKKEDKKDKNNNHLLLMVLVLREHLENPSSLVSFVRGTTFLRSVPASPVYKKNGLKDPNHLCHQPLIIMLTILPQPVTHW